MGVALLVITFILCTVLLILYRLRSSLPWRRVNCWFCNSNTWIKVAEYNQWTCPKCKQYNGFNKDGDYNKAIITTDDQVQMKRKFFQKNPSRNGLCKICNINQNLKVTELANFVPLNDKSFDAEIEDYRMQLEKAYKLCSPCRKAVQNKLYKDKKTLLNSNILGCFQKEKTRTKTLKNLINYSSMLITAVFLINLYEFFKTIMGHKLIRNIIEMVKLQILLDRLCSVIHLFITATVPSVEVYYNEMNRVYIDMLPKILNFRVVSFIYAHMMTQEVIALIACLLQIVKNVRNVKNFRYTIVFFLLWTLYFLISIADRIVDLNPLLTTVIKMASVFMILLLYINTKKPAIAKTKSSPAQKKFTKTTTSMLDRDEIMTTDSDDDFGLDLSHSSVQTISSLSESLVFGRTFSPRLDAIRKKPPLDLTSVNSVSSKSPNSTAKPSFNTYQKLVKDDSDSDLDECIRSLSLGDPIKSNNKTNSMFSLRKYTAPFVDPTVSRSVPLLSLSRLGHRTTGTTGNHWAMQSGQNLFNVDRLQFASENSAFEPPSSSGIIRNDFSQPPSREESVYWDRFNISSYTSQTQNFSWMNSPIYPHMQCNGYVNIPHPRCPPYFFNY